jgi:hypothetical protein
MTLLNTMCTFAVNTVFNISAIEVNLVHTARGSLACSIYGRKNTRAGRVSESYKSKGHPEVALLSLQWVAIPGLQRPSEKGL